MPPPWAHTAGEHEAPLRSARGPLHLRLLGHARLPPLRGAGRFTRLSRLTDRHVADLLAVARRPGLGPVRPRRLEHGRADQPRVPPPPRRADPGAGPHQRPLTSASSDAVVPPAFPHPRGPAACLGACAHVRPLINPLSRRGLGHPGNRSFMRRIGILARQDELFDEVPGRVPQRRLGPLPHGDAEALTSTSAADELRRITVPTLITQPAARDRMTPVATAEPCTRPSPARSCSSSPTAPTTCPSSTPTSYAPHRALSRARGRGLMAPSGKARWSPECAW